jgi:predicted nucleotidyltransferase
MRLHHPLDDVLPSKARLGVLRILTRHPQKEFTGRELSRLARISLAQTQEALGSLQLAGLVHRKTAGRSHQWQIEGENILFGPMRELFRFEGRMLERVRNEIAASLSRSPVISARIYGSVAHGQDRPDSDLDLFVEVRDESSRAKVLEHLGSLALQLSQRFGLKLSYLVVATARRSRVNPNVLADVDENGMPIDLVGKR